MKVKIIYGVKLEDGVLHNAGEVLDVDEALGLSLVDGGEAESYDEPKVTKVKVTAPKTSKKEKKEDEGGDEGTESPLLTLPYRTLQVKAGELGMPKVVGKSAGDLAAFIEEKLSPEEVEALVNAQQE